MQIHAIRDALAYRPFLPFKLMLVDGRSFEVRHPDFLNIRDRTLTLTHVDGASVSVIESILVVSLEFGTSTS